MKNTNAFGACFLKVIAISVIGAPLAKAGGLSEAQLMGIYQRCLYAQTDAIAHTVVGNPERRSNGVGSPWDQAPTAEYHNPLIGAASLNIEHDVPYFNKENWDDAEYQFNTHFEYRSGKLQLSLENHIYSFHDYKAFDLFTSRDIFLPYYDYKSAHYDHLNYDNFGVPHHDSGEGIETKPQLMVYKGPSEIPLLNKDTGQPIRDSSEKPIVIDVKTYKDCITGSVDRAYAQPTSVQVAASDATIDANREPKAVPNAQAPSGASAAQGEHAAPVQ